ncbi:MarR family winged helix-turn-helix transcriptional regulator [Streptomyces yerevanensis]|uniref:MarR family winged helix-turn-helix transcriptional regulator n=1 Tax=Streptomyces yerevanensis TaxID=66378 RepID=UPI00068FC739|nr:MarR family winged helix-turn-helix transcriptional regulator [Streptomyces yerevanensis]
MLLGRHLHLHKRKGRRKDSLLDRSAYILLSRIRVEGPLSIGRLCDAFDLDASTLNRQTAAAVRAGLLEHIPDPEGGMARKFRITAEGERLLDAERRGIVASLDRIMAGWDDADIAAFAHCLQRFSADLERLDGRP